MNCPHCGKVIIVKIVKDSNVGEEPESVDASEMGELLNSIDLSALEEGENKFVTEQIDRYEKYGDRTRVSPKQLGWLRKLAKKAPKGAQGESPDWSHDPTPF